MKRSLLIMMLLTIVSLTSFAQDRKITGTITDKDTKEHMLQVTVQLLKADSTFVTGAVSNDQGVFTLTAPSDGKYLLKLSSIGYLTNTKIIQISQKKNVDIGNVIMKANAVMLKGATVTGQAMKVAVKEDTFVYNASAYRTPDGSVAEELVKRIPGAQIDDSGNITINGKQVKKIMVDGKEFMTGDTKTAVKNIPTSVIETIKSYDEKSDLAKVTGIEDGNEQTVLDFGLKRGMNKGFMSNVDLATGTKDRYAERLMGAYFKDNFRIMGFMSANNINDVGFGGRGGSFGRGRNGLNAKKMTGVNINYEKKDTLKINGNVRWNHSDSDVGTISSSQNFVSQVGSFSNSNNQAYGRNNSWNANMRLEWTPDTLTNIMFRPTFSYSTNDDRAFNNSASFNNDPYLYVSNPLLPASLAQLAMDSLVVNSRNNNSLSYGKNKSVGGMLQYNRKLGSKGRNLTLRADANFSQSDNNSLSISNVHLYKKKDILGNDSTYQTNRYNLTPTKNWSYSFQTTYSEPLWRATFLQLSYQFRYSYSKSDRSTYDFSNLGESFFADINPTYRGWDSYLNRLSQPYKLLYLDNNLSRFSEYKNYTHELQLMFRMIRTKYNFSVGVMVQPQKSNFIQHYQGVNTDTVRNVINVTPTLDYRYRFSKVSNLRINYQGSTAQPNMTDLLAITDDSNPLNIVKGNPGLKPSFTNQFRLFYNNYLDSHQQAIMTNLTYNNTSNNIVRNITYDETTGGMTSTPENINGNWNISGGLMYNRSIDSTGVWNINTWSNASYTNNVGYVNLNRSAVSQESTTRTLALSERLAGSYRNDWLEIELDGSADYNHSRNNVQTTANLDTWRFAYGVNVTLTAPWGTSLATDLHENSRRGFNDQSMNTNELVWNAQLSQSFLKKKSLTVSLQFYDILNQQSNFSRMIDAMQRSDTQYNSIHSFAMLHVIYRVNLFGDKQSRQQMRDGGPGFGGPGRMPGQGPGRRGGGGDGPGGMGGPGGYHSHGDDRF